MKHSFDYFYTREAMDTLEIENTGNCCIECANDEGLFWYIIINTSLGMSSIFTYGPTMPDIKTIQNCCCTYSNFEYSEKTIEKAIDMFINDKNKKITQAREIDVEEALNNCADLIQYFREELQR